MPRDLTKRQAAVLSLVARGCTNREIAEALGISEDGAKGHVARLLSKFGVPTRAALVRAADTGASPASGNGALQLLRESLEEVIGPIAAATLMTRASKRAGIQNWQYAATSPDTSALEITLVAKELWPLLIEMTGNVLVNRLRARGFDAEGEMDAREIARWLK